MAGNGAPVQGEKYDGQNCETPREGISAGRGSIIAGSVKALAAAALACSLNMTNPQEAQAQETFTIQPAVLIIPDYSADENPLGLAAEVYDELVDSFISDLSDLPEGGDTEILDGISAAQILRGIKYSGNLDNLFDAVMEDYQTYQDAEGALRRVYEKMNAAARMVVEHADAIALGRDEVFNNMKQDPDLEGLEDSDYAEYRDEIFNAFIRGIDDGTLSEFIRYTPAFTQYAITFPDDFSLAEELAKEADTAELESDTAQLEADTAQLEADTAQLEADTAQLEARQETGREIIAEENARQAEENAKQEALRRLRIALQGGA